MSRAKGTLSPPPPFPRGVVPGWARRRGGGKGGWVGPPPLGLEKEAWYLYEYVYVYVYAYVYVYVYVKMCKCVNV